MSILSKPGFREKSLRAEAKIRARLKEFSARERTLSAQKALLRKRLEELESLRLEVEKSELIESGRLKKSKIESSSHAAKARKEKNRELLENEFDCLIGG